MTAKKQKKKIKASLLDQLSNKGAATEHYIDLIEDYMNMWETKRLLFEDIDKRGVTYQDFSNIGVEVMKNNPSVKEVLSVNKQMLAILRELGITTKEAGDGRDAEL